MGAFLGLATANPQRRVIGLIGDGSFQMAAQEVSTILRYTYSCVIFLMNNGAYTIEVMIHDGPYNTIQNWKYAAMVEALKGESPVLSLAVRTEKEIEIHEYQPTMYHCKVMIVDGLWTSVGSTNFDPRSFSLNDEANVNYYDRDFARRQIEIFQEDLVRSR